jgi:hypothetical protein
MHFKWLSGHFVASGFPNVSPLGKVRSEHHNDTPIKHTMPLTPVMAIGPIALWARQSAVQRPHLHRAAGYARATLKLACALSALLSRDHDLPNA